VTEVLAAGGSELPPSVARCRGGLRRRLDPQARALLEAVSIVPGMVPLALVTALGCEHADRLDTCLASGMLVESRDRISFRHDLARAAIADEIEPLHRAGLHRIALDTLRSQGADAARLAHHAEAAGDVDAIVQFAPIAARAGDGAVRIARRRRSTGGRCAVGPSCRPIGTPTCCNEGARQLSDRPVRRGHRVAPGHRSSCVEAGDVRGETARCASSPPSNAAAGTASTPRPRGWPPSRSSTGCRPIGAGGRVRQPGHAGAEQQRVRRLRRGGRSGPRAWRRGAATGTSPCTALNSLGTIHLLSGDGAGLAALLESLDRSLAEGRHEHAGRAYIHLSTSRGATAAGT
jgi:hypothetical protein